MLHSSFERSKWVHTPTLHILDLHFRLNFFMCFLGITLIKEVKMSSLNNYTSYSSECSLTQKLNDLFSCATGCSKNRYVAYSVYTFSNTTIYASPNL